MIDNASVRVTEWAFANKGDHTGWHEHMHDYVVVPMFNGVLDIDDGTAINPAVLSEGQPYYREKGVKHDVINGNDFACRFIEVEILK
jgi:hypothetical protein